MEILLPVSILNFYRHLRVTLHPRNKFYPNWTIIETVMTLCRFFKMAAIPSQILFCFLVLWHLAFRKAKNYLRIKFPPDISIHSQVITTSGCWRQTSAIFKFYSRFQQTLHHHRHFVILHWPTKFYANWMIADGVMTSYWFYKMAAITSQIYFWFLIWSRLKFRKVQSYRHTKFRPDISIQGRDITTSGLWKQTAAILKF